MANVIGPLFSLQATGTIAKTLCYKKGMKGTVCRKYAKPTGLPSPNQIAVREFTGELMNHWPLISPKYQASWLLLALDDNIEPINAYLKFNWQRHLQGLESTDVYPPSEEPLFPDIEVGGIGDNPNPDCRGTYVYFGENDGQHVYRRSPQNDFYLSYDAVDGVWEVALFIGFSDTDDLYYNFEGPYGHYEFAGSYTGSFFIVGGPS